MPCSETHLLSGLAEGSHTLTVRAIDLAGNVESTPSVHTWIVDTVTPDTEIVSGPPAFSASADATFQLDSNEAPGVTFECSLDGGPYIACSETATFPDLGEGPHTLSVRSVDLAGNVDPNPVANAWTVDTITPDTEIVSGPGAFLASASANFGFDSDEAPAVTYECDLDGVGFASCAETETFASLAEGPHTLTVRATDPAGNIDLSPAGPWLWTVDTLLPDTTIVSGPPDLFASSQATFELDSNEAPDVTFECNLDDADFVPCDPTQAYSGLAAGRHTLLVRATDLAGNVDAEPAEYLWKVEAYPIAAGAGCSCSLESANGGGGSGLAGSLVTAVLAGAMVFGQRRRRATAGVVR